MAPVYAGTNVGQEKANGNNTLLIEDALNSPENYAPFANDALYRMLGQNPKIGPLMASILKEPIARWYMRTVALKDQPDLGQHGIRTACIGMGLAKALYKELKISDHELRELGVCLLLHDVGKFAVPREILYKPDSLSPEERKVIEFHTEYGLYCLNDIVPLNGMTPPKAAYVALSHHRGAKKPYPYDSEFERLSFSITCLSKAEKERIIKELLDVIGVADLFEAMSSADRGYRSKPMTNEELWANIPGQLNDINPLTISKLRNMVSTAIDQHISKDKYKKRPFNDFNPALHRRMASRLVDVSYFLRTGHPHKANIVLESLVREAHPVTRY
ncbi:MAG: HD domain-containing phosphohydrolase [Nanoarchaeota archaeon]